jgi:hypothetical protein
MGDTHFYCPRCEEIFSFDDSEYNRCCACEQCYCDGCGGESFPVKCIGDCIEHTGYFTSDNEDDDDENECTCCTEVQAIRTKCKPTRVGKACFQNGNSEHHICSDCLTRSDPCEATTPRLAKYLVEQYCKGDVEEAKKQCREHLREAHKQAKRMKKE